MGKYDGSLSAQCAEGLESSLTPIGANTPGDPSRGRGSGTVTKDRHIDSADQASGAKPPKVPTINAGFLDDTVVSPGVDEANVRPVGQPGFPNQAAKKQA